MKGVVSWKGAAGIAALVTAAAFATNFLSDYSYAKLTDTSSGQILYESLRFLIGTYLSSLLAMKGFASIQK